MTPAERQEVDALLAGYQPPTWEPQDGPQKIAYDCAADVVGFGGSAGGGKGLALDTPLPTPSGWTTMGDVQVGDVLFDEQGRPCRVTAVSEISHRPCYRLAFDDDSELVADDVHRWLTFNVKELGELTRRDPEWRAARRARRPSRATKRRSALLTAANAARAQTLIKPAPAGTVRETAEIAATLFVRRDRRYHAIPVAK
jgi:hypothetical protein